MVDAETHQQLAGRSEWGSLTRVLLLISRCGGLMARAPQSWELLPVSGSTSPADIAPADWSVCRATVASSVISRDPCPKAHRPSRPPSSFERGQAPSVGAPMLGLSRVVLGSPPNLESLGHPRLHRPIGLASIRYLRKANRPVIGSGVK